jgi:GNAT superfamily N-acetyltransferase
MSLVIKLEAKHKKSVLNFLSSSPLENLKLISMINQRNLSENDDIFYVYIQDGNYQGVIGFDWEISIFATSRNAILALAEFALCHQPFIPRITGKKETIDLFWDTFRNCNYKTHFDKILTVQSLEKKDFIFNGDYLKLQRPDITEAEEIAEIAAAMNLEEGGIDLMSDEPLSYLELIKQRITNGNYFILREDCIVKFIAVISFTSTYAAQFDEVYVVPEFRRQNYAFRCLGYLCKYILENIAPRVCGIAHTNNIGPLKYYKKLGFKPELEFRSIYLKDR